MVQQEQQVALALVGVSHVLELEVLLVQVLEAQVEAQEVHHHPRRVQEQQGLLQQVLQAEGVQ